METLPKANMVFARPKEVRVNKESIVCQAERLFTGRSDKEGSEKQWQKY